METKMTNNKIYKPVIVKKEINNEHYYYVNDKFTPGVTTILGQTLPMPYALRKWIGDMGNERAEAKFKMAGERGTAIHNACEMLLTGAELKLVENFPKKKDQKAITGFINWFSEVKPEFELENIELVVASELGFAGTLDLFCKIDGVPTIVDFKTSSGIHESHKLQITAYQKAYEEMTGIKPDRLILHLNATKRGYSVYDESKMVIKKNPITVDDFMIVFAQYVMLNGGQVPEPDLEEIYPEVVQLFEEKK